MPELPSPLVRVVMAATRRATRTSSSTQWKPHRTQVCCLPELPLLLAGVATAGARGCMPELPSPLVRVVMAATRRATQTSSLMQWRPHENQASCLPGLPLAAGRGGDGGDQGLHARTALASGEGGDGGDQACHAGILIDAGEATPGSGGLPAGSAPCCWQGWRRRGPGVACQNCPRLE